MMKKRLAALLMAATMGFVSIPVHASEEEEPTVEQAEGITEKTTTYDDHQVVKVTDEEGNSAVCDSRNDYVEENGEKIHFSVETVADIEPVDEGKFAVGIEPLLTQFFIIPLFLGQMHYLIGKKFVVIHIQLNLKTQFLS